MRDDYKIKSSTERLEIEIEKEVRDTLIKMSEHTKLTPSEITNTALRRFISHHKDFLPNR